MWPFKRKRTAAPSPEAMRDPASHIRTVLDDAPSLTKEVRPATSPRGAMRPGSWIVRVLPIGKLIEEITGLLKDPNGKISSKRAGAGALVVAGIAYVAEPETFQAGIVCLVAAILLFVLTKYEAP